MRRRHDLRWITVLTILTLFTAAHTSLAAPPAPKGESLHAPGAFEKPGDQGLIVTGRKHLEVYGGPKHPSGEGLAFLPFKQGTVEFFMKPEWSTADLPPKTRRGLFYGRMAKSGGSNYYIVSYTKDRLEGYIRCLRDGKSRSHRTTKKGLAFKKGEWVHVAWVWGKDQALFINGKKVASRPMEGFEVLSPMTCLVLGHSRANKNIDAVVDELRVSDIPRYDKDFTPSRKEPLTADDHTRALFHFDGDLNGVSATQPGPVKVRLRK